MAKGLYRPFLMADMPFMTYTSREQALQNAVRLMQEGGAKMVKLEGGAGQVEIVEFLAGHDIAVCAHLGLKPQSVHKIGGFRVQGREEAAAEQMTRRRARRCRTRAPTSCCSNAFPPRSAQTITRELHVPVIGIGAGPDTDGQILVLYDVLDITPGRKPRSSQNFMEGHDSPLAAVEALRAGREDRELSRRPSTASDRIAERTMQTLIRIASCASSCHGWRRERRAHRVRADDGQPARGPRRAWSAARTALAERVIVSIFVNPLQFGPNEDFAAYPRTPEEDRRLLETPASICCSRPRSTRCIRAGRSRRPVVDVPDIDDILCGAFRPGSFHGVATVVAKLLNLVQPDVAMFGEKDYQQLLIIRRAGRGLVHAGGDRRRADDARGRRSRAELAQSLSQRRGARASPRDCIAALDARAPRLEVGATRFRSASSRQGCRDAARSGIPPGLFRDPPTRMTCDRCRTERPSRRARLRRVWAARG